MNAIPLANNACPVISQLTINVSIDPVMRQLTALARLRTPESIKVFRRLLYDYMHTVRLFAVHLEHAVFLLGYDQHLDC